MPVEVRELVIKAIVEQAGGSKSGRTAPTADNSVSRDEEVIKMCVEKVLEILEARDER